MARLPDIPVQSWIEDQTTRFQQATGGYFDALEFEDGAKQAETTIPPDYPLPGGPDQWNEAEQKNREEELRREQDAADQAQQQWQAQRVQELEAQQQQAAQAQQQQAQDRNSSVMAQIRSLGIPTPDQIFGNLSATAEQQPDHTSTSGLLDQAAPPAGLPADTRQADLGAHEAAPEDQFSNWVQQMNEPVFGPEQPPADHTSSTGLLDPVVEATRSLDPGRPPESLPERPLGSPDDHDWTAGIRSAGRVLGSAAEAVGSKIVDEANQPIPSGFREAVTTPPGTMRGLQIVQDTVQAFGSEAGKRVADELGIPDEEVATVLGYPITTRNIAGEVGAAVLDPTMYMGAGEAPAIARAGGEALETGARAVGRGAAALAEEGASRYLQGGLVPHMAEAGGGGSVPDVQRTIDLIRQMRDANLGDDLVLQAEQKLAQGSSMTLDEIQALTRNAPRAAAQAGTEAEAAAPESRIPTYIDSETGRPVAAPTSAPAATPQMGDEVRLPDGTTGTVTTVQRHTINGETRNLVGIHNAENRGGTARLVDVADAEVITPAARPAIVTPPVPDNIRGPVAQIQPAGALTAEQRAAVEADAAALEQMHRDTAAGIIGRSADHEDVSRVMNALESIRTQVTDRHANLAAVQRYVEKLKGSPLAPDEQAWLLARVYQGHADAALARMEATVMPAYSRMHPADNVNLESFMQQLDNLNTEAAVYGKEQNRVLQQVPTGKPGVTQVRREGEATLNEQRARSSLQAAEKEFVAAQEERNTLLAEMERSGDAPVRAREPQRAPSVRTPRSPDTASQVVTPEHPDVIAARRAGWGELNERELDDALAHATDPAPARGSAGARTVRVLHATADREGLQANGFAPDASVIVTPDVRTAADQLEALRGPASRDPGLVVVTIKRGAGEVAGNELHVNPEDIVGIQPVTTAPERPVRTSTPKSTTLGPERSMETNRSETAADRLERSDLRLRIAEAQQADARQALADSLQASRARGESRTMERAATRAETLTSERRYSGGATPQESAGVVKQHWIDKLGPERAQKMFDAADAFYTLRDQMRDRLVSSGVWTQEYADGLKEAFPFYSPTRILKHLDAAVDPAIMGSRSFSTRSDAVKHLTPEGTEAARMAPTQALVEMAFKAEELAARNTVISTVHGWMDQPGMQSFIKEMKGGNVDDGWKAMAARINGEVKQFQVVKPLADALDLSSPLATGVGGAILSGLRAPLQAGATALRPAFIFTNAVNDAVLTLYRFATESGGNPIEAARGITDLFRGYHAAFGAAPAVTRMATGAFVGGGAEAVAESTNPDDPNYWRNVIIAAGLGAAGGLGVRASAEERAMIQRARLAGGSQGATGRFTNPADVVRRLRGENIVVRTVTTGQGMQKYLQSKAGQTADLLGLMWSRPLSQVGTTVELAPRLAAFSRAERQGRSQLEAAQAMRRVTVDFAAGGRLTKSLNQFVPFLNAATQASVEGFDMFRKNPASASATMAVIIGGIVASELHNRTVAPDEYKDISAFTRDTGIVWLDPTAPQGEGKRGLVYMPMRGWPGMLVPLVKAAMRVYLGDDPRTWQEVAKNAGLATVNQLSPINADVGSVVYGMTPPLLSLMGQYRANYDAFRDQPIVSRSMEGLPASEQYNDRTSQFARQLSRSNLPYVSGASPMKLDWFARNFSPGPGEALLGAADQMIHMTGNDLPSVARNVPKGGRDVPLVGTIAGRVLRTVGSERQNIAYEQADQIVQRLSPEMVTKLEQDPEYQSATPARQQQLLRSMQAEVQKQAEAITGVPDYAAPKDLGLPYRYFGVPGGSALETEVASALAAPRNQRTIRQEYLAAMYSGSENPMWTDASKQDRVESEQIRKMVRQGMGR